MNHYSSSTVHDQTHRRQRIAVGRAAAAEPTTQSVLTSIGLMLVMYLHIGRYDARLSAERTSSGQRGREGCPQMGRCG